MYQTLILDIGDKVATITLNRPEVYNAFNDELSFELQDALKVVSKDAAVRVVVITGAGKAFCSGQDLKAGAEKDKRSFSESLHKRYNPIIRAIRNLPKPVICRLNGVAAGAGCSLALACDMIIAAESAALIEVFINIGLVPDSGSSYFLPRTLSYQKAFELASRAVKLSAREAQQLGFINKVVADGDLDAAIKAETDYYVNAPTKAIGLLKKMLGRGMITDLDSQLDYEAYCQDIASNTKDYEEGVKAFLEKRKPLFKGE